MAFVFCSALFLLWAAVAAHGKLNWNTTEFLFTFGDSYTTDGFNISAGVNSPVPGFTSSNGPNWVEFLGGTYNVTDTKVFNLASGGATIDAALVAPYLPTVLSIVDQVSQFETYLADKPEGAQWRSDNSLFAVWIGINDVGNSYAWANVTSQSEFHHVLMSRLFSQVEKLYDSGARSFLFLTVPPTNRAPLLLEQGATAVRAISAALDDYNAQLAANVQAFKGKHRDLDQVTVFDTRPVFNLLLDNANTLGFVNATGFCDAYQNGTPDMTTQIAPCAPVSSYFWLNTLHPLFTVHNILAHAIATKLSG
ncbi:carbohydrate esterase family 16 protein [Phanerochaete sordida]|uniref:Carbohydrate esterase family 16 protein n=1 Tax=Phanerochaete sordida TaxID=48140 RepID=A0A9P3G2H3_9APHY|nr:carbohydrate esterase family 16 protein [Phanerochaete sordida]